MGVGYEECDTELGLGIKTSCGKNSSDETLAMARQNIIDVSDLGPANSCYSKQHGDTHNDIMDSFHKKAMLSFHVDSNFINQEISHGVGMKRSHVVTEDYEGDKAYCRVSDEDEEGGGTRKKLRLSKKQSAVLEETFKVHSNLNPNQKHTLAKQLNLCPRQVEVWFQNRRARTKLKQTEVDRQFLRRCYESLAEENKRLQKELIELRSLKHVAVQASPSYIKLQLPSTTISMCPSCQRVITSDNITPFTNLQESHFYPCYSHSSMAC